MMTTLGDSLATRMKREARPGAAEPRLSRTCEALIPELQETAGMVAADAGHAADCADRGQASEGEEEGNA